LLEQAEERDAVGLDEAVGPEVVQELCGVSVMGAAAVDLEEQGLQVGRGDARGAARTPACRSMR
jgi:hypothetical protein